MLKKRIAVFICSILYCCLSYGHFKLLPGYYITVKGDTIRCSIDFRDRSMNPDSVEVHLNGKQFVFGPGEINGFGVDGYSDFISKNVSYHTNPVTGAGIPFEFSDSVRNELRFLKVLENGNYSLYSLIFPERIYFFMSTPDKPVTELVYRMKIVNDSAREDNSFRKTLFAEFAKEGIATPYSNRINRASYNASDIAGLVVLLNESVSGIHQTKKRAPVEFQADIFGGVIRNTFPSSLEGSAGNKMTLDPSYDASLGINLMLGIPGKFQAFKIGLSFGYTGYNSSKIQAGVMKRGNPTDAVRYTITYADTVSLQSDMLLANLYILYLINPLHKVKWYLKAGAGFNFNIGSSTDNDLHIKYLTVQEGFVNGNVPVHVIYKDDRIHTEIKDFYPSLVLAAGMNTGRSKLEFSYSPVVNIGSINTSEFKTSTMSLYYYFSIFQPKKR